MAQKKNLNHLAVIMDGNGRWAKKRGMSRVLGHERGADVAIDVAKGASANGSTADSVGERDGAAGARFRRTSTCTVLRPAPTAVPARSLLGSIAPSVSLLLDRLNFFVLPLSSLILNLSWHQRATPLTSKAADRTDHFR